MEVADIMRRRGNIFREERSGKKKGFLVQENGFTMEVRYFNKIEYIKNKIYIDWMKKRTLVFMLRIKTKILKAEIWNFRCPGSNWICDSTREYFD